MVKRIAAAALAALSFLAAEAAAQAGPRLELGVRPARVRVGDTFVLSVRVGGAGWPQVLDVEGVEGAEVVEVRDRSSAALGRAGADVVVQRDFVLRALVPGEVAPAAVLAVWGADTVRTPAPRVVAVGSAVAWMRAAPAARRERDDPTVRDEGRPPTGTGRDADRTRAPWGYPVPGPYGTPTAGVPGAVAPPPGAAAWPPGGYGPSGWGVSPPGEGWAATAAGDPWWPELIPRLERYHSSVRAPEGWVGLEAGVTPATVYAGQQVTLVATATLAPEALARLGAPPEILPPAASGAWTVDIPYAPPVPAAVGGRVQEAHTFMRAYFPTGPGTITVEPTRLLYTLGGGGGGAARPPSELATDPIAVQVLPVPAGDAPPGWKGAVGRYRVRGWVEPASVRWGEAALLVVEVAGAGNVRELARPDPGPVWGAELRPAGERADVEVRDGVVGGTRTFSWLVVPSESGTLRLGPVVFSWFDPWLGAFGQGATPEIPLQVDAFPGEIPGAGRRP